MHVIFATCLYQTLSASTVCVPVQAVAVVQRAMRGQTPEAVMAELGFGPLMLIKAFPVSMSGRHRNSAGRGRRGSLV
jgi:hypothetical protein